MCSCASGGRGRQSLTVNIVTERDSKRLEYVRLALCLSPQTAAGFNLQLLLNHQIVRLEREGGKKAINDAVPASSRSDL